MIDLISSKTLSVMRSFSISSGDVTILMLCVTVGDLIFYKRYPSTRGLRVVVVFLVVVFFIAFAFYLLHVL